MTDENAGSVTYDFDWNPEKAKSNLVGNMPGTKAKLSKRLGHQGMEVIPYTKAGTSQRGYAGILKVDDRWLCHSLLHW